MSDRRDHAEPELPEFDDEAIDLALVHADDEYLDLLGGAVLDDGDRFPGEFGDEQLTELLMSWRRDVDAEPIDDLVDTKLATVTVQTAKTHKTHRPRLLVPLAAAAAVLAIMFAGVGLAARDAQPGDTLWALSKVLYSERARSVEAAETVKQDLAQAKAALTEGNVEKAKTKLEEASSTLPTVASEDGKDELRAQHASLLAQLPGNPSGEAGPPPDPAPSTQETEPDPGSSSDGGSTDLPATGTQDPPADSSPVEDPSTVTSSAPTDPSTDTSRNEPEPGSSSNGEVGETESGARGETSSVEDEVAAPAVGN
jgi:hypothetical protein